MEACIEALDLAYKDMGVGQVINTVRLHEFVPEPDPESPDGIFYRLNFMAGAVPRFGVNAVRLNSGRFHWPLENGVRRHRRIPVKEESEVGYVGLVLLFSLDTGELLAIIHDAHLGGMRVGAASGVAAKYLAREDSKVVGIFGSGFQARTQLSAHLAVRPITEVKVFSPNKEHREKFSKEISKELGVNVKPVDGPNEVVRGSDIVLCATNSNVAVFSGELIEPGTHIGSIVNSDEFVQQRELDDTTFERATMIVLNWRRQAHYGKQRDLLDLVDRGRVSWGKVKELGEIVQSGRSARSNYEDITLYKANAGLGMQFAAVGALAYERALKKGLGQQLPDEWFLGGSIYS
jgi:ornithine cyclodeaminase/alanine dehydrogenase-like protein (mu-crystallin family)